MFQLFRTSLFALVLVLTALPVCRAEARETVHIGRISASGDAAASTSSEVISTGETDAASTQAAESLNASDSADSVQPVAADAVTTEVAAESSDVADATPESAAAPMSGAEEALTEAVPEAAVAEPVLPAEPAGTGTPVQAARSAATEPAASPALAKSRAEYEKAMAERGFTILPGVSPIHDLILADGHVCETFDGGYMVIDKKDDGKKVVHNECGRLWCDEQSRSYRIYYHGEYASDFSQSFVDKTVVQAWDKKPALCNAD